MIISDEKKFIFIHIYKTGGTSITDKFVPYSRTIEKISTYWPTQYFVKAINVIFGISDMGNKWINGLHKHASALEIQNYLGKEKYNNYYKFTIVRNPYDLQVSLYHYIKGSKLHKNYKSTNKLTFEEFVKHEITRKAPLQSDFLLDEAGNLLVDYIGKLENIGQDIQTICAKLNIQDETLIHTNKSKREKNYAQYYNSELKQLVYEYYSRDFKLFGYDK